LDRVRQRNIRGMNGLHCLSRGPQLIAAWGSHRDAWRM